MLRNFTSAVRWFSNLQDSRPFEFERCANYKKRQLYQEKIKFWARKCQKNGFFGVFTHYCTESLRNFTVVLRWCSSLQDVRLFDWARCASNKMDNFIRRKKSSWPKNIKKMGFLGFSHITAPNRFAILLQGSYDAQTYRIVARFNLKGGEMKIEPQNNSQLLFIISEISRVSRSWFSLCEILAHFPLSYSCFNASIALKLTG